MTSRLLRFVLLILMSAACARTQGNDERVMLARIVDGDTFEVMRADSAKVKIRLIGVDCPESRPNTKAQRDGEKTGRPVEALLRAGKSATAFVSSIVEPGDTLGLEYDVREFDPYGRRLAYVYLPDGRMLNEVLLLEGIASLMTMPPNVKHADRFLEAFRAGRGREGTAGSRGAAIPPVHKH